MEELLRVRPPRFAGEVVNLVAVLVILVQQPLHLRPRVSIYVFCDKIPRARCPKKMSEANRQHRAQHGEWLQLIHDS